MGTCFYAAPSKAKANLDKALGDIASSVAITGAEARVPLWATAETGAARTRRRATGCPRAAGRPQLCAWRTNRKVQREWLELARREL